MKITQFISTLGFGGAESVVRDCVIELKKRGHDVTILLLLPFSHNDNELKVRKAGVNIISVYEQCFKSKSTSLFMRIIRKSYRTVKAKKWITKYINTQKIDVFHVHLDLLRFIPIGICKNNGTKLFHTCHSEATYYFGNKNTYEYKYAQEHIKKDNLLFFALHTRMKDELNQIFNINTTKVMKNPIDITKFMHTSKEKNAMKQTLGICEADFVIGHVGRFVPQKNHSFLIDIFYELLKKKQNAKLVLVGDGDLKLSIEKKCKKLGIIDNIIFTGIRQDIPDILNCFDIFLFPSKHEGLGITFLEAQIKVPYCVASTRVPLDTAVTDKCAFVDLDKSISVWVDTILNPQKFCVMHTNELEEFDLNNVITKLEGFYAG